MKKTLLQLEDRLMLQSRGMIESVNNVLKNTCQIEHTRHRSPINFFMHLIAGLVAYTFLPKKPSLSKGILSILNANF